MIAVGAFILNLLPNNALPISGGLAIETLELLLRDNGYSLHFEKEVRMCQSCNKDDRDRRSEHGNAD